MAYTEFYCNASTGSNLNGGSSASTTGTDAAASYGRDTGAAGVDRITASSGTPFSACVANVDFVGIKAAGGSGEADAVYLVTAVNGGGASIDVDDTKGFGTRPANAASVDVKVGGAWKGPNAAVDFPFDVITNATVATSTSPVRINLKNNATYSVTAAMAPNQAGVIVVEGYTTTPGDGGQAIFDASGVTGSSIALLNCGSSCDRWQFRYITFQNNGDTGNGALVTITSSENMYFYRCKVANGRGHGATNGQAALWVECEFTGCNQSNTASTGALQLGVGSVAVRCYIHDNTGSNTYGVSIFGTSGSALILDSIIDTNGGRGINIASGTGGTAVIRGCDIYGNGGDGFTHIGSNPYFCLIENTNFVKNGGYGINRTGSTSFTGYVFNCGFGSGTQQNTSGTTNNLDNVAVSGSVTYPSGITPWVDPANGDFRLTGRASRGTGRGSFPGSTNTVSYPDIGAAAAIQRSVRSIRQPISD